MIPSEEKFLKEYNMDGKNIVVCTDDIKKFNVQEGRGFVITQSIKKLKNELKEWIVDSDGWRILGNLVDIYNIKDIEKDEEKIKYIMIKHSIKKLNVILNQLIKH